MQQYSTDRQNTIYIGLRNWCRPLVSNCLGCTLCASQHTVKPDSSSKAQTAGCRVF